MIRHIVQVLALIFCCGFVTPTTATAQTVYTVTDSDGNVLGDVAITPNGCAFRNNAGQVTWEAPLVSRPGTLPLVFKDANGTTATISPPGVGAGTWSVTFANGQIVSGCLK